MAKCFTTPGGYGRDLVSSGPYMIQGSAQVNIASCGAIKPMSGFDPSSKLILVRNPNYDPRPTARRCAPRCPNKFAFTINTNQTDIFNRIHAGLADDSLDQPPGQRRRDLVAGNASQRHLIRTRGSADGTKYISMNLTQAPFDDIHVRRAVNFIMDKAGLQQANGGPLFGEDGDPHRSQHDVQRRPLDHALRPVPVAPNRRVSLRPPRPQMRQSKYDPKHDGLCDASACKNVFAIDQSTASQDNNEIPVVQARWQDRHHPQRAGAHRRPPRPQRSSDGCQQRPTGARPGVRQGLRRPVDVHGRCSSRRASRPTGNINDVARRPDAEPGAAARHHDPQGR